MPILTFPLSRIEGHAQVVIEVQGGKVVSAHFQATEFRGFEQLVKCVPAEDMIVIVPRICGVCSTAHHVAAVEALEDAYGVSPPPLAQNIRELLLLGQLIQNQATSLFIFTMPDRLGTDSIFQRPDQTGDDKQPLMIAQGVAQVRKAGTNLIKAAGGQFIHPVKAVVGGTISGVTEAEADASRAEVEAAIPVASRLFDYYIEKTHELKDRIGTLGDDAPAYYIAAVGNTKPDYTGDRLRLMDTEGMICDEFPARDFWAHLTYEETDYSYSGKTSYKGNVIRANSLARINMAKSMGTPRADEYLRRFKETFGQPAHAILLFDIARGIELVYALERAREILAGPLDGKDTHIGFTPRDGEGYGLVEAPRGPLIHHYVIQKGLIFKADFIIPTVHNVMAIEQALRVAAQRYITAGRIDMELEHAVGRVVRAFDPCIACATH
jgi:F420-non-reducing hydrogenase large subunit